LRTIYSSQICKYYDLITDILTVLLLQLLCGQITAR